MDIKIASVQGMCHGVKRALDIVNNTIKTYPGKNIYLFNQIVHNDYINNSYKQQGVTILDETISPYERINSVDDGIIIFSAHGHDRELDHIALEHKIGIVDATCPYILLNERLMKASLHKNRRIVFIGLKNHPETVSCLSIDKDIIFIDFKNPNYSSLKGIDKVTIHNQTTLIQEELYTIYQQIKNLVKDVEIKNDICYATSSRQKSLLEYNGQDFILIIGDKRSSNSTRLFEIAKKIAKNGNAFQVSSLEETQALNLNQYKNGFVTSGASVPDEVTNPIINYLKSI